MSLMPMSPRSRSACRLTFAVAALSVAAAVGSGCDRRDEIAFYNAPKDPPAPAASTQASVMQVADPGASPAAEKASLHWDAPREWKEMPAGQMRVAVFRANDDP